MYRLFRNTPPDSKQKPRLRWQASRVEDRITLTGFENFRAFHDKHNVSDELTIDECREMGEALLMLADEAAEARARKADGANTQMG